MSEIKLFADAPYDEVVDSIADVIEIGIKIDAAIRDGLQFEDLLVALELKPRVEEVIDDVKVFADQFSKLSPATALAAVAAVETRIIGQGKTIGKATRFILDVLNKAAGTYGYIESVVTGGLEQFNSWKSLKIA